MRLRLCADFEPDLERFAFEAGRHRQHDIGKRGRRRHEQVGMGVEIERGQRSASANRIAVSEQQVCTEPDESADGIGLAFQNSPVEVPRGNMVPARRSERTFGNPDCGSKPLCCRQVLSGDRRGRHRREQHVAARRIETAGQCIEHGHCPRRLRGVGVMLVPAPGIVGDRAGRARSCGQLPPIGRQESSTSPRSFPANICCRALRSGRRPDGKTTRTICRLRPMYSPRKARCSAAAS